MRVPAFVLALVVFAVAAAMPAFAVEPTAPPTPDHYVTDPGDVLSSTTRTALENELRAYEKATGHQIILWIGDTTGDVPLETWTTRTADRWKIGHRSHDDGAVLFVFMQDHKIRIEVGYGLESALPDATASRIISDDMRPRMRAGDTDGAVSAGIAAMLAAISPSYKLSDVSPAPAVPTASPATSAALGTLIGTIFVVFWAFIVLMIVMQIVGRIRYGYLVTREGAARAKSDMRGWWFWSGVGGGGGSGWSSGGGGGFSGGGFSAGGGGFGGGGASGGW